jgi:hypothetical protein
MRELMFWRDLRLSLSRTIFRNDDLQLTKFNCLIWCRLFFDRYLVLGSLNWMSLSLIVFVIFNLVW